MGEVHRLTNANGGTPTTEDVIATLEDAIRELRTGKARDGLPYNKAMLVLLHDDKVEEEPDRNPYEITWYQCGMRMSECISLCRISEQYFMQSMGHAVLPEDVQEK